MNDIITRLHELYADTSKHSNYQNIPTFVQETLGYTETIDENWRGDTARYKYILAELEETELSPEFVIGDVGANTGFFSLSLAYNFPETHIIAYEINPNHVAFMREVSEYFNITNLTINQIPLVLDTIDLLPPHDLLLHLNVLHHAGHDFDKSRLQHISDFESYALEYLIRLRQKAQSLVFQMGTNWGGDKSLPIVPSTDDYNKLRFMYSLLSRAGWKVVNVALATRDENNRICYREFPKELTGALVSEPHVDTIRKITDCLADFCLDQFTGEFYRRPLIICRSSPYTIK